VERDKKILKNLIFLTADYTNIEICGQVGGGLVNCGLIGCRYQGAAPDDKYPAGPF